MIRNRSSFRKYISSFLVPILISGGLQVFALTNSQSAFAATGDSGSIQFNGTSNYLTIGTPNSAFGFGTTDFTIEFWWYATTAKRSDVMDFWNSGATNMTRLDIGYGITGGIQLYTDNGCSIDSGLTPSWNQWTHIALTRSSGSLYFWVNGAQKGSISCNKDFGSAGYSLSMMKDHGANSFVPGNLTNIRVVKNNAVYTSAFTPSTSPLGKVNGTSFLLSAIDGDLFKDWSDNNVAVTAPNGASFSSSSPFPLSVPAISAATISGNQIYGEVLTANTSVSGNPSPTVTYSWKRNGTTAVGTASTYTVQSADVGSTLSVTATAVNSQGTRSLTSGSTSTVTTRPITLMSAAQSKTYTGTTAAVSNSFTRTSGTLAGSDAISELTYRYTSVGGYNSLTAPTDAGTYTITPSAAVFTTGSASNYSITYATSTLTIGVATTSLLLALPSGALFATYGTAVVITATTSTQGTVTFKSGSSTICSSVSTATVSASIIATCSWTPDTVNTAITLTANFVPTDSANFTSLISAGTLQINVGKKSQSLTFSQPSNMSYGDADQALTYSIDSALSVSLTSSTPSVCTIQSDAIRIVSLGTCTVAVNQTGNSNYSAATQVTRSITVSKAASTISASGSTTFIYTGFAQGPSDATVTGSTGSVTYSYSGSGTTSFGPGSTKPTNAGTYTVTASVASSANYNSASSASYAFNIAQAAQGTPLVISSTVGTFGTNLTLQTTGGNSGGSNSFNVDSGPCTVLGPTLSATAAGTCMVTATKSANGNYLAASSLSTEITMNKATPTFTWSGLSKIYGATAFNLTAPSPSTPGTWTYDSGTPSVISLNGISATVAGYGTAVITATFTPTDIANYVSGGTIAMTVTVSKATLGITASSHTVAFGDAIPTIAPSYLGFVNGEDSNVLSNLTCSTTYTTTTAVGTTGSTCSGATANNYSFSYTAGVITISQGGQTSALTIDSTSVIYGSTLALTTLGGNGSGANSFVVNSGPCTVSSSTLTPTAAGTCMVTATKAANGNYLASSSVSTAITVAKKNLTISGLTGVNKVFDGELAGTVTGTPSLVGVVGSDNVALTGTPTFAFATADVANTKSLTGSGYGLTNSTASNYTLTQPVVIANVTQKAARVIATNLTIASSATVTSSFTTSGLVMGDSVTAVTYSYSGTGTSTPPTAVGVYTITPSFAVFGFGTIGNYSITYDQATLTILAKYSTTYNANGGVVSGGATASVDFVVGDNSLTLPTPTRANYTFTGWHTLQANGTQVTGAYTPTATATLWAHWVQNSLYGMGSNTKILTITTLPGVGNTYSANAAGGTIGIEYLADALPAGTVIDAYVLSDTSTAATLIGANNTYVMSLVLAWVALDSTVPTTAANKAISMTITNSSIKKGAKIYSVIGSATTLLGVATVDGSAVISITDDPQIIIAITKPDAPTDVSATTGGNAVSTVSWTAPANDGGSAIISYTAASNAGQKCTTVTTTCLVSGLTNGTSYTFTVSALNSIGASDTSTASIAITPNAPAPVQAPVVVQTPIIVVTQAAVSTPVPAVIPSITALTFVENATKTGGKLIWTGTNIESVLFTGVASIYPAPFNYGAFTLSWDGSLVNMVAGVTYTMKIEARSSTGGSDSKTITYTIAKPVVDTTAADVALKSAQEKAASEKAAAEKKAAEEAAAAALKIAQEKALADAKAAAEAAALKIAQEKAAAEAKAAADAAALKIAQEKAAAEAKAAADSAALKVAQEKAAAEAKAAEEAAALKVAQDKAAADALAIAKSTPVLNLFSSYATAKYTSIQTAKMKKLTLKLEPATTLKCVGYINTKGTTAAKAKSIALAQAKTACASAKKLNPSITTVVTTAALTKAPKPLVGASNTKAKYRVDLLSYKG